MADAPLVRIDIVSDVVCPWCVIGYLKLDAAMARFAGRARFDVSWHPFELNPSMPAEGQDVDEHVAQKYGSTPDRAKAGRDRMRAAAAELGFTFARSEGDRRLRMVNTYDAHRLLGWAATLGDAAGANAQTELQMALFRAHFTELRDVSDIDVLIDVAGAVGLDAAAARNVLSSDAYADQVRRSEAQWQDRFISGVPAIIFNDKFMVPGAQEPDVFASIIENKILAKAA